MTRLFALILLGATSATEIPLVTFDGAKETAHNFKELNDPVMGGKSTGTWSVANNIGIFDGEVVNVPKLKAPGFITSASDGSFPDASAAIGGEFVLKVRTITPEYRGFRFSFASGAMSAQYSCAGGGSLPFSRGCFKSHAFNVSAGNDFTEIRLPIDSFSDKWSPSTGEQTTLCSADKDVCPTAKTLRSIQRVQVWAEGAAGKVHLEIQSISIVDTSKTQVASTASKVVPLATFDGAAATSFNFKELNDPVMGGKSTGTWSVDSADKIGVFDGEVVDVPSLKAPGFIKAAATGKFPDASEAAGGAFVLTVRTSTPEYRGFRFSFASGATSTSYACAGGGNLPFSRGCFKSKQFNVSGGDEFVQITLPLSSFSDKWSSATGEQTVTCADDKDVCPTASKLAGIQRLEIWAEGALGKAHLEIRSIAVVGPSAAPLSDLLSPPPSASATCQGPVQNDLRFNISSRDTPETLSPYVNGTESLAEAVCCDRRTIALAEPQFTFIAPDINLFSHLDSNGVTTFYDSVCGIPVFRAPVGRSLDDFRKDTEEHGWPSFREAEIVAENIMTDEKTGYVTSKCGTHLGSYLPDEHGKRWCIDLSCVAGRPTK